MGAGSKAVGSTDPGLVAVGGAPLAELGIVLLVAGEAVSSGSVSEEPGVVDRCGGGASVVCGAVEAEAACVRSTALCSDINTSGQ